MADVHTLEDLATGDYGNVEFRGLRIVHRGYDGKGDQILDLCLVIYSDQVDGVEIEVSLQASGNPGSYVISMLYDAPWHWTREVLAYLKS